jgi:lambda family phage portal protein
MYPPRLGVGVAVREVLRRWFPALRTRRLDAASGGRRWSGVQSFGNVNAEIGAAAGPVRRRASYYARNNPWISNGVSAIVSGAVGAGIKPQSQHPDPTVRAVLHARWQAWTDEADADGVTDAYGLQALAVRAMVETGEVFAHLLFTPDGLRVRLLDAEMVPLDETRELEGTRRVIQGVEFASDGSRAAYHVHRTRPEVPSFSTDLARIPAAEFAHLFVPLAPGQVRGISWLAPVLLRLHELDLYEDAQLVRQKVAALFAGFVLDPTGTAAGFDGATVNGVLTTGLEPGTLKVLPPGFDIKFSDPAEIGDAVDFLKLQLRSVAAGLGVPEYLLTGDLSQANYSSLRAALVEFRTRIEQLQFSTIVFQLLRPIWRAWVLAEVLSGRIVGDLDELLSVEWITPAQPWVDPSKDAEAARLALAGGLTSRRRVVASLGWDVEALDQEIAADRAREKSLGLVFGDPPPATSPAPVRRVDRAA